MNDVVNDVGSDEVNDVGSDGVTIAVSDGVIGEMFGHERRRKEGREKVERRKRRRERSRVGGQTREINPPWRDWKRKWSMEMMICVALFGTVLPFFSKSNINSIIT